MTKGLGWGVRWAATKRAAHERAKKQLREAVEQKQLRAAEAEAEVRLRDAKGLLCRAPPRIPAAGEAKVLKLVKELKLDLPRGTHPSVDDVGEFLESCGVKARKKTIEGARVVVFGRRRPGRPPKPREK